MLVLVLAMLLFALSSRADALRSTCRLDGFKYAVDGTPEAFGLSAFGLPVVLGREAWRNRSGDDVTVRGEAYAGRRTFSVHGRGPPVEQWSDRAVEDEDTSSASGPITNLCVFSFDGNVTVPSNATWLFKHAPAGFNLSQWFQPKNGRVSDGGCCPADNAMCIPRVMRFQGLFNSKKYALSTGSSGPALPDWYHVGDTGEHYLRAIARSPLAAWLLKRSIEINAFKIAVHAMYFIQQHVPGGSGSGFCNSSFPARNDKAPWAGDVGPAPYTLADFGTETHGGVNDNVAARLYVRELGRVGSPRPVGAALLYDGTPRCDVADRNGSKCKGRSGGNTKKHWEPESVVFPLYGTDFTKGVLGLTSGILKPSPSSSGDGVLSGNGPSDGNMHGMTRELLFPDRGTSAADLRSPSKYPPTGNFTLLFAENLLTPGSPRSTFMLQSSARIGCFASNIGGAAAAFVVWSERLKLNNASAVDPFLIQVTLGWNLSQSITYFDPLLKPRARGGNLSDLGYAALQVAGAYAVPPELDIGDPLSRYVSQDELRTWMISYKQGLLTGQISPPVPQTMRADDNSTNATRSELLSALSAAVPSSALCAMTADGMGAALTLQQLAHVLMRHVGCSRRLLGKTKLDLLKTLGLRPYDFKQL